MRISDWSSDVCSSDLRAEARQALFRRLCAALDIDATTIEAERLCAFMTLEEARELQASGIEIGLHSHRHRFPAESYAAAQAEIEDNRRALALETGRASGRERVCQYV